MRPRNVFPLVIVTACGLVATDLSAQPHQPSTEILRPAEAQAGEVQRPGPQHREQQLLLEAPEGAVETLRITDLEGTEITNEVQLREDEAGRITLAVPDRRAVIVKDRQIEVLRVTSDERLVLPGGLLMLEGADVAEEPEDRDAPADRSLATAGTWLRLTLKPSPVPAPWSNEDNSYVTHVSFGVHPSEGVTERSINLEHPVEVRISLQGLTAKQELPPMRIEAAGLAHERMVPLLFVPTTPNPTLQVRSTISDVDVTLNALPRMEVRPESTSMMGFGLERMDVRVQRVEPHGAPLVLEHPVDVSVTLTGDGRIETGPRRIDAGDSQVTFGLRSSGWGHLDVTAAAGGLSGAAVIEQRVPWSPFVAALVGGAIGGYARRFIKGANPTSSGRRLAEGIIVAIVAYVAAVLGVGYLGLPTVVAATEAGAFLTGALTGFIGVNVLEALSKAGRA